MTFSNVDEATHWLLNQVNPLPRPDMTKMYQALEYVGNPHLGLPIIHITGTNGKGSTVAYLRDLLSSQGFKVGAFTSPHIERFNERITFDGQQISDQDLIRLTNRLVDLNAYMEENSPYGRLIYFELFTIMMCLYFQEKQPDVCLIEAGIGGMSDCTNVLDGEIAVITSIGMDHADMLGDTLESVALEKAGIIKSEKEVVTGLIQNSPLRIIDKWADARSAVHHSYDQTFGVKHIEKLGPFRTQFQFWSQTQAISQEPFEITMIGDHQVRNAAVSLQVFLQWMTLKKQTINWSNAKQALKQTKWIGRLEKIMDKPYVFLDGAHNMEGLAALKKVVDDNLSDFEITIIYGGLKKKNQAEQIPLLLSFHARSIFLTSFHHFEAMKEKDFLNILQSESIKNGEKANYVGDWKSWMHEYVAANHTNKEALLLITGSLYFVSEARAYLLNDIDA
ncbi:bifunctional folylpolyglutamate synthase/dihydrofolate synthase [Facklamia miroungae]|uniref:tetrahydrofolate synthase n=1 Tax=Facklamia miroungae TaxID=120956 RepID=A0A1G7TXL7_9LACT|nr:folylpolyglutamate synthase/dihydrofolate synthase family protein [Facklamia miroungae]NKZ29989.1 bifunctional folylpolyglutamate synthase/dihydrofolate synthase [Facklamia miroungae]SDG39270.1 dihydrofolate synthase / folylpolyglutamate synthase [Facklamia miroungae]